MTPMIQIINKIIEEEGDDTEVCLCCFNTTTEETLLEDELKEVSLNSEICIIYQRAAKVTKFSNPRE